MHILHDTLHDTENKGERALGRDPLEIPGDRGYDIESRAAGRIPAVRRDERTYRGAETFARQFPQLAALKLGKNRVHLDLVVDDLDQSTAEIGKLGGRWLEPGNTRELEGFRWRCMADPEGNEFDIDVLPGA